MIKKEAQYCRAFFLTLIGGPILIIPCIAGIILSAKDNSFGNYGASEADTLVIMLIATVLSILGWIIGINHYITRWSIAAENKQIEYECDHCDKILMIPEIDVVEQKQDQYLRCPTCNRIILRKR